jgi:hypothetical protein
MVQSPLKRSPTASKLKKAFDGTHPNWSQNRSVTGRIHDPVNLTLDMVPEVRVVVHREGEVFVPAVEEEYIEIEETEDGFH